MKLFACFAAVKAGIGDGAKQLTTFQQHVNCVENDENHSINPLNPPTYAPWRLFGTYSCAGPHCQLYTCQNGYQGIPIVDGAAKKMTCKYDKRTNTYSWNKPGLWYCASYIYLEPLHFNPDFKVDCRYENKGGYNLKVCNFECANGEKIYPLNKKKVKNVMCKCDKRSRQCNWKKGRPVYDNFDHMSFGKWSCPKPHQIPKHLRCMKNNYSGRNLLVSDPDRIVNGAEAKKH